MPDYCEWNPIANRAAFIDDPPHGEATLSVGVDGKWHLCEQCAQLPAFSRYRVRRLLHRRRPERVQRKMNRQRRHEAAGRQETER